MVQHIFADNKYNKLELYVINIRDFCTTDKGHLPFTIYWHMASSEGTLWRLCIQTILFPKAVNVVN